MKIEVTANWWPIGFPVQEASRRLANRLGRHSYNGGHIVTTSARKPKIEAAIAEIVEELRAPSPKVAG